MTEVTKIKFQPPRPIHLSAKGIWEFTPEGLEKRDPKPVFFLHIPTYAQRDSLSQLIYSSGCMPVTVEHGRAVLISELFEVYDSDPANAPLRKVEFEIEDPENPGETIYETREVPKLRGDPDEMASFLEGYYQRSDVYEKIVQEWAMQEKERLLDEIHSGQQTVEGVPLPPAPFTPVETARATRLSMDMLEESTSYRKLQSRYADYEAREDLILFRLFCAGWEGLETKVTHLRTGLLAETSVERLREELAKLDDQSVSAAIEEGVGARQRNPNQYFHEVVQEIRQLTVVDKELEKNSASPLGNGSNPSGSPTESGGSASGDGEWTESSIEQPPVIESPPTSDTSSN